MKELIIKIPEGWEFSASEPTFNQLGSNVAEIRTPLKRAVKYREPMLPRDYLKTVEVRDSENGEWIERRLLGVYPYAVSGGWKFWASLGEGSPVVWKQARIRE